MFRRRVRSALLVDFDNLIVKFGSPFVQRIGNWLDWLEDGAFDEAGARRKFLFKRVYWFTDNDVHRPHFLKRGFDITISRAVKNKEKASSADFDITIDAVELPHRFKHIDEVLILSFDSDFLTVLNHLQLQDIAIAGMAFGQDRPAKAYRALVDHVLEKEIFERAAFSYTRERRGWFGVKKAAPTAASPPAPHAPSPRPPRRKIDRPAFDLSAAARVAAEAAAQAPSAYLSKRFVTRALEGFKGFRVTNPYPWLGCGSYEAMIEKFVSLNQNLQIDKAQNGGLVLVYRGPSPAQEA